MGGGHDTFNDSKKEKIDWFISVLVFMLVAGMTIFVILTI